MSDDATLFANDQVREELRASIYYLSAIAATVQKSSNYDDESDAPLGDIPLKTRTKTGRLLNDLSTSLSRGGTDATRVIAVTSAPFFNRNRDLAVSVFSSPTLSPSNSSSAHKAEESGVEEEASSAEPRDVIITRNGGHKKLGARSQSLIPVPIPGQPLDFCVPKEFTQFAKHSLELLRAAACKMRSESPEEAAKTRLEVCVYFTDACQQKLAQRMHLLTDAYPIHKLQAWSYKSGVDPLDELPVSVDNSVVGFVLQTVGLIGRGDIYPYNKLTAGLWWKAVVFSLHQLDRAQKIANFRMTVKFSEALHDLLQIIPGEFWDSDPLVLFLRRCRFIPPPPIASLVEATSQEDKRAEDSRAEGGRLGDPTDSDAEGDQQHSNTERKREHGEEEDKQQDGDTDSDQPDDSTELKEKLGDEDERPDGDTDGEEYENIGNILPTVNPSNSKAPPECTAFTRMVDAVCAWTTGSSRLLDTPIARSTAPIHFNIVDLERVAVPRKAITDLIRRWTIVGAWSSRVAERVKGDFLRMRNSTVLGTTHCEAGLVAIYLNHLLPNPNPIDNGREKGADYTKLLAGTDLLSIGVVKKCCPICSMLIETVQNIYHIDIEAPGQHRRYNIWVPPASLPTPILQRLEWLLVRVIQEMVSEGAHLSASRALSPTSDTSQGNRKKVKLDIADIEAFMAS